MIKYSWVGKCASCISYSLAVIFIGREDGLGWTFQPLKTNKNIKL